MAFEQKYEEFKKEITTPLVSDEERVEIIILDHENSRDMTLECLKCILEKVQYPIKITVYDNTLNSMNTAKIWNKLIKQSTCGYVLIMDNDAFAQNDFVSEMVRAVERHTNAAVVGPVAGDKSVTTCQEIQPIDKPEEEVDGHISGYCMLFRRKIFDEFRYFDEDFMFYGQESDWMQEIIEERKYRIYVVPRAYVKHGIAGEASISSMRKLNQGGFDRGLDAEYSEVLFNQKKELRKQKRNESNVCR
jgi:cellulose synthase/poly-beta-1,6-N-acetylglucosamine synthase-like glycosyltransferase